MISLNKSKKYLEVIHDLNRFHWFYDVHTHPLEIIFNEHEYKQPRIHHNLYSAGPSDFHPPKISEFMTGLDKKEEQRVDFFQTPKIVKRRITSQYSHTGPSVFEENMNISGIDRVLLLPVASPEKSVESQIPDPPFWLGSERMYKLFNEAKSLSSERREDVFHSETKSLG